ncbi:uncharacterized protein LOC144715533 [Wolffia australiana]
MAEEREEGNGEEIGDEEREIRDLEDEVSEMAEMIQNSRRSLAARLGEALSKQLAAQRPRVTVDGDLDSQDCVSLTEREGESDSMESFPEIDEEMRQKIETLKTKIRSNMEAMPEILNRIKGCIERVNRLNHSGGGINPVFKKRRKNWTSA